MRVPVGTTSDRSGARARPSSEGWTLVELLVVLGLLSLFLVVLGRVLVQQSRLLEELVSRVEIEETVRITTDVVHAGIRSGRPGIDWGPVDGDSLPLRVFRGVARTCGGPPGEGALPGEGGAVAEVAVAFRGEAAPVEARDSILVLPTEGPWTAAALSETEPGGECAEELEAGEVAMVWRIDPGVEDALFLRLFRRSSYHLADGAFRAREGGAGRQPLTPERLRRESGFRAAGPVLEVDLLLDVRDGDPFPRRRVVVPFPGDGAGQGPVP